MAFRIPKRLRKQKNAMIGGSSAFVLTNVPTDRMDSIFGTEQDIRPAPHSALEAIELNEIHVWCMRNAVYQVPTTELIEHLRVLIGDRKAIEICSGNGVIGRAIGIPMTDSFMQLRPDIQLHYKLMGQPIVAPPGDVEKLDALEAVRKHDPEVVIGCFVTQLGTPDVEQSSPYGVDERALMDHPSVQRYIMVGNVGTHGKKRAFKRHHQKQSHPWLVSRSQDQSLNRIFVWDCK